MSKKKSFRQRLIGLLGETQQAAADAVGLAQANICQWAQRSPIDGSMVELVEAALDTLDDEQLRAALTKALEKRAASTVK